MAMAIILGTPVFFHWLQTSQVPVPGQWIFAGTLFCLGLEASAAAFLLGIFQFSQDGRQTNKLKEIHYLVSSPNNCQYLSAQISQSQCCRAKSATS